MAIASEEIEIGPLLVNAFLEAGKIDTAEFSFAMAGFDRDFSSLDIGSPIESKIRGGLDGLVEVPMYEDFFWSQSWQGVRFNLNEGREFAMTGDMYTIIDTGSSHFFIPATVYMPFMLELFKTAGIKEYAIQYGQAFVECKYFSDFRPVQVMFNNNWITIMPEHYIWDVSGDGSICTLLFMMNGFNFALMGQPLFHGYYTHHSMADSYIAFGPLARGGSLPL